MTTERKFGHRWWHQITVREAAPGDLLEYTIPGRGAYWARIAKVTKKGLRTVTKSYGKYVVRPSKLVKPDDVRSVWRKGKAS